MRFDRTGIIFYVFRYKECIAFYENIPGLEKMFQTDILTCSNFGNSYLMVEFDDENSEKDSFGESRRTCLRMNVPDVKILTDFLKANNIEVKYLENPWGTIANFCDPDGNLCAFKDTEKFEKQIEEFR